MHAHREGRGSEFCRKHGLTRLVYAERHDDIHDAIAREKAMKRWKRQWKLRLIRRDNPDWNDLFETIPVVLFRRSIWPLPARGRQTP